VPDKQDDQSSYRGANQTGALVNSIPANCLTQIGCHEGARDPQNGRENEPGRIIGTGRERAGDQPRYEPDDDDPKEMYRQSLATAPSAPESSLANVAGLCSSLDLFGLNLAARGTEKNAKLS
jgi:hypothetical protein